MMADLAKMATGLMARGGVGPPLRLAAAAPMFWAAWRAYAPVVEWTMGAGPGWELLGALAISAPAICGLVAIIAGSEGRREWARGGYRCPWGLADFLRRAPFVCWCLMTDDGDDVPLWAILAWPFVAVVEIAVAAWLLAALPCFGFAACGRAAWRVLSVRPLDRGK